MLKTKKIEMRDESVRIYPILEDLERLKSQKKEIILEKKIIEDRIASLLWQGDVTHKGRKSFLGRLFGLIL
jgi:hypothetical protein